MLLVWFLRHVVISFDSFYLGDFVTVEFMVRSEFLRIDGIFSAVFFESIFCVLGLAPWSFLFGTRAYNIK